VIANVLTVPRLALHLSLAAQLEPTTKARTARTASSAAPATPQQLKAKHLKPHVSSKLAGGWQVTACLLLAMSARSALVEMTQIQLRHSAWHVHLASQHNKMSQRGQRSVMCVKLAMAGRTAQLATTDLFQLGARPLAMPVPAVLLARQVRAAQRSRSSACRS
jgi:hypothetical protein